VDLVDTSRPDVLHDPETGLMRQDGQALYYLSDNIIHVRRLVDLRERGEILSPHFSTPPFSRPRKDTYHTRNDHEPTDALHQFENADVLLQFVTVLGSHHPPQLLQADMEVKDG
jgi:hypothetical protein